MAEDAYSALVVSLICSVAMIVMTFHILNAFRVNRNLFKSIIFLSSISIATFLVFTLITTVLSAKNISNNFIIQDCIFKFSAPYFYSFGKILMYLFFISRLKCLFQGSIISYDPRFLNYFFVFIVISLVTPNLMITAYIFLPIKAIITDKNLDVSNQAGCDQLLEHYKTPTTDTLLHYGIYSFALLDMINSIIILRLYLKNLLMLYTCWEETNRLNVSMCKQHSEAQSSMSAANMEHNNIFLQTAIKLFNLTIFGLTSSWFMVIVHATKLGRFWLSLDMLCNALSMYLSFKFSKRFYDLVCGNICCNNCCFKCCMKLCTCCLSTKLPSRIQLAVYQQKNSDLPVAVHSRSNSAVQLTNVASVSHSSMSNLDFIPVLTKKNIFDGKENCIY